MSGDPVSEDPGEADVMEEIRQMVLECAREVGLSEAAAEQMDFEVVRQIAMEAVSLMVRQRALKVGMTEAQAERLGAWVKRDNANALKALQLMVEFQ